jgi:P-type Cu+ transporter
MSEVIRLSISGMSCAGCLSAVEKILRSVADVEDAFVNLGERTAIVSGEVNADDLVSAVKQAGYDVVELTSLDDETEKEKMELKEYKTLWARAIISAGIATG